MSTETKILEEIKRISREASYTGKESAREFYSSGKIPKLLKRYFFEEKKITRAEASRQLGMSTDSLRRVLTEYQLSENMLFRIQNYFIQNSASENDWVLVSSHSAQSLVIALSNDLQTLYEFIQKSNSLGSEASGLSPIQRAQLVAMLEGMLALLKAPALNKKHTSKVITWMGSILKRGVERGMEKKISDGLDAAVNSGSELLKGLKGLPSAADLADLFRQG